MLNGEETNRLKFRLLEQNDFSTWLELFKDQETAEFLTMGKIPTPEERCKSWFERNYFRYENDLGGMNVLIDKATNSFIGQCGLLVQDLDNVSELEIGYSILPKFRKSGYATEAAKKCRDFAFENKFSESLISIIHTDNFRSERVAQNNGMILDKKTSFRDTQVNVFRITYERYLTLKK